MGNYRGQADAEEYMATGIWQDLADKDAEIARLTRERDDSHRAIVSLCPEGEDCIPGGFSAVVAYFVRRIVEEVSPQKHALREAEAEIARLRAALEWYATGNSATPGGHCGDYGERARAALAPRPEVEP